MTIYLYPQNLRTTANLWLWGMRDFVILCVAALLSVALLFYASMVLPGVVTLCFGFLTIRVEETTMMDYLGWAVRFFLTAQQEYVWR